VPSRVPAKCESAVFLRIFTVHVHLIDIEVTSREFFSQALLQQILELGGGHAGLTKNRRKRSFGQVSVQRNYDCATLSIPELHMTSALSNLLESVPCWNVNDSCARHDWERWGHAETVTLAIRGGSIISGRSSS